MLTVGFTRNRDGNSKRKKEIKWIFNINANVPLHVE